MVRAGDALERRVIRRDTSFDPSVLPAQASIQEIYGALAADNDRLGLVLADICALVRDGRALLVLTERREHLERIAKSIGAEIPMPIAWKGTLVQYAGRLHRAHAAKRDIRIYDYVDSDVPVLRRMYTKRLRAYKDMGHVCDEAAQELSFAID